MFEAAQNILINLGAPRESIVLITRIVLVILTLVSAVIIDVVTKKVMLRILKSSVSKTTNAWDDILLEQNVFDRFAHLLPVVLIFLMAPIAFEGLDSLITVTTNIVYIYIIFIAIMFFNSLLNATDDIYKTFERSRDIPIKSFIQVIKLVLAFVGIVLAVATLLNQSPLYLLSGLGALTAVLMLVFKDPILGFVAGVQLIANRMVAPGDWIEMPKYGADGDVMEINLTTVKVKNFDNTVTTIPTYALISDSFKNWRGMQESAGRRIKRSIYIDINSIKFLEPKDICELENISLINDYLDKKITELEKFNADHAGSDINSINGRRLTNVGTFRAYLVEYLRSHELISKDLTLLVRQLAPTENGLPIELYVFSTDKDWINFENIQSDIFDHIYSVLPEFGLRAFQTPTGSDFLRLKPQA